MTFQMARSDIDKSYNRVSGHRFGGRRPCNQAHQPESYIEHNPRSAGGVFGLREYINRLSKEDHRLKVVRAFQDGHYVFTQEDGLILGRNTFFDVFRFEDGLIVEHWVFSAQAAPPNESGHTQTDGPTQANLSENTEKNKSILRDYYETVHISGDHSRILQYFSGDYCVRHEPGVRDGVGAFIYDLGILMQHRSIDEVKFLLAERDFVFIAAMGTVEGKPCAYIDLYRVEDGKIAEHWGFPEKIPPEKECKNYNGLL
jgi:predicted SnoaL-like aldol condensation-catalyzing enzyme